jgi:hypothetical protein
VPNAAEVAGELKKTEYQWSVGDKMRFVFDVVTIALSVVALKLSVPVLSLFTLPLLFFVTSDILYFVHDKYFVPEYNTNEEIAKGNIAVSIKSVGLYFIIAIVLLLGFDKIQVYDASPESAHAIINASEPEHVAPDIRPPGPDSTWAPQKEH